MPIRNWSTLNDETNGDADLGSGIRWTENQDTDTVNNSSRAEMAEVRKWFNDIGLVHDTTGTGNAYEVTASQAIAAPLVRGDHLIIKAHATNDGPATLNVNGIGGVAWQSIAGTDLAGGAIQAGQVIGAYFDGTRFLALNIGGGTVTIDRLDANTRGLLANVGDVKPWFTDTPPDGWLICNGDPVSRSDYSQLFAVWGTTFGAGDGSTTFNLIDLTGEFLRGLDTTGTKDPDATLRTNRGDGTGGAVPGSKQADEFRSHSHDTTQASSTTGGGGPSGNTLSVVGALPTGIDTSVEGGNETRSRNIACNWIVLADAAAAGAEATYIAGLSGYRFTFDPDTDTTLDPGTGQFRLNTNDLGTFTEISLSDNLADEGNADVRSVINTWGATPGTNKGRLKLSRSAGPDIFTQGILEATTGQTGFTRLTIAATKDGFNGMFQAGESVSFDFTASSPGTPGETGADAGQPWNYSTDQDTSQNPGSGNIRVNATGDQIAISAITSEGANVAAALQTADDSTTVGNRGHLTIKLQSAPGQNFKQYQITGDSTDNTSWFQFAVNEINTAGTIGDTENCVVQFSRTGDQGGQGQDGQSLNWQGDWLAGTTYDFQDGVAYQGSSYISLQAGNQGNTPPNPGQPATAWWDFLAEKGQDGTGTGDVNGPASAVDGHFATFDGTTGKLIQDGGTKGALAALDTVDTAQIANDAVDQTKIAAGAVGSTELADNAVTDAKLRDSAAVSVIGRSANTGGDPADIAAAANNRLLAREGDTLSFTQLAAAMATFTATSRILGRATAGAGDGEELTAAQILAMLGDTRGNILRRGETSWEILGAGSEGTILEIDANSDPQWVAFEKFLRVWTTGQVKEAQTKANWNSAWNAADGMDVHISNTVPASSAGNLPVPADYLTLIGTDQLQDGSIMANVTAGTDAGFDPLWQFVGTAPDLSAGGIFKLYYTVEEFNGTTYPLLTGLGPWS